MEWLAGFAVIVVVIGLVLFMIFGAPKRYPGSRE